ncbi:hypothetical protein [Chryseolinea lacunae]|uniref:Phytanoyl-CoA dioxygenase n=1 Tax=Chryseolinea lacunae TaxID=2801331 RepID=A0ABS1L1E1_9BACT|nr:hypothetical protein [Chryseolinea lacunae]MBL0745332.1 hypothetical protein [Chryseolinea lacunae]
MENYPRFELSGPLRKEHTDFFAQYGFLHFSGFVPRESVNQIRDEIRRMEVHDGRLWHPVAQATILGEQSRRQVMHIPIISGAYAIKHEKSPTLMYQHFQNLVR